MLGFGERVCIGLDGTVPENAVMRDVCKAGITFPSQFGYDVGWSKAQRATRQPWTIWKDACSCCDIFCECASASNAYVTSSTYASIDTASIPSVSVQ